MSILHATQKLSLQLQVSWDGKQSKCIQHALEWICRSCELLLCSLPQQGGLILYVCFLVLLPGFLLRAIFLLFNVVDVVDVDVVVVVVVVVVAVGGVGVGGAGGVAGVAGVGGMLVIGGDGVGVVDDDVDVCWCWFRVIHVMGILVPFVPALSIFPFSYIFAKMLPFLPCTSLRYYFNIISSFLQNHIKSNQILSRATMLVEVV